MQKETQEDSPGAILALLSMMGNLLFALNRLQVTGYKCLMRSKLDLGPAE